MYFNTIQEAVEDIKQGKMIVVADDENRENEGDLLMAAQKVTPETVNFMASNGRGMICVPIEKYHASRLGFFEMVQKNMESMKTAFTVTVDHKNCKTGISAFERALTIREIANPCAKGEDFVRPGHVFPIISKEGGVLRRAGHTEAAVDIAKIAGLFPAGVICEIMNDDGTMARGPQLFAYVKRHGLKIITIADLIKYRRKNEKMVERVATAKMPTIFGNFLMMVYQDLITKEHHIALIKGDINKDDKPVLVRVHSECLTGDVLHSLRCDCGAQLHAALKIINDEGRGVLLYMRQEGRGIGLVNKIRAYGLQDQGKDTVEANEALGFPADLRDYGIGAQILADIGAKRIRLLTNNPKKIAGLEGYEIQIVERMPLQTGVNEFNKYYLRAKKLKLGHMLDV